MPRKDRWAASDVIGDDREKQTYPIIEVSRDTILTHRPSRVTGSVASFTEDQRIVLEDEGGKLHEFKPHKGVLLHNGKPVQLRASTGTADKAMTFTASGSVDIGETRAQTAKASRIWVEGIHDAELIEKIWGDDLRVDGIVVEPLHGADDLVARITEFRPGPNRRLGILIDHLVEGSKESRIAAQVVDTSVLVRGHPYVDIWQAIKPDTLGIDGWPVVPRGQPWKEAVVAALGRRDEPGRFWQTVLSQVSSYRDVETPLVNSVEQLIDFVSTG